MLRALSTRGGYRGYDRLIDESSESSLSEAKLSRARSVPVAGMLFVNKNPSNKLAPDQELNSHDKDVAKQVKKASKLHPIFSLFERKQRKRATARPEFSRYLQYVKEGGIWDVNSARPVIHYN